jgi:hypothetical protein
MEPTLVGLFEPYTKRIFPLQIVMALAAAGLMALAFLRPIVVTAILVKAFLAITLGWIALAFLFIMRGMRERFPFAAHITAAAYLPLAIIFIADIAISPTAFRSPEQGWRLPLAVFLMLWGILLYPVSGYLVGHRYPGIPLLGAMPCPTNIYAIGFQTAFASSELEIVALFIISAMAIMGAIKAAVIGHDGKRIREDLALLVTGLYGLMIGLSVLRLPKRTRCRTQRAEERHGIVPGAQDAFGYWRQLCPSLLLTPGRRP